jgi:hypothetical protein
MLKKQLLKRKAVVNEHCFRILIIIIFVLFAGAFNNAEWSQQPKRTLKLEKQRRNMGNPDKPNWLAIFANAWQPF